MCAVGFTPRDDVALAEQLVERVKRIEERVVEAVEEAKAGGLEHAGEKAFAAWKASVEALLVLLLAGAGRPELLGEAMRLGLASIPEGELKVRVTATRAVKALKFLKSRCGAVGPELCRAVEALDSVRREAFLLHNAFYGGLDEAGLDEEKARRALEDVTEAARRVVEALRRLAGGYSQALTLRAPPLFLAAGGVMVFLDPGYRTDLGVPFHDRLSELGELGGAVAAYRLVVVYGPRNVGKSELARYWGRRRSGLPVVYVQADLLRASGGLEALRVLAEPLGARLAGLVLEALRRRRLMELGLAALAHAAYEALRRLGGELVILVDEFHLLPAYQSRGEALRDLEALAHFLAKAGGGLRVVATVSEGLAATWEAAARLHGYQARLLLVEEMEGDAFKALYEAYRDARGCTAPLSLVEGLAGRSPGYLPHLCHDPQAPQLFVEDSKRLLEEALAKARRTLPGSPGPRELVRLALRAMSPEGVRPLEEPLLHELGKLLSDSNIAYPKQEPDRITYRPQAPVYTAILQEAADKGYTSVMKVDAQKILERATSAP